MNAGSKTGPAWQCSRPAWHVPARGCRSIRRPAVEAFLSSSSSKWPALKSAVASTWCWSNLPLRRPCSNQVVTLVLPLKPAVSFLPSAQGFALLVLLRWQTFFFRCQHVDPCARRVFCSFFLQLVHPPRQEAVLHRGLLHPQRLLHLCLHGEQDPQRGRCERLPQALRRWSSRYV